MNALVNGSNQEIQKSFSEKANSTVIGGGDEGSSNFDLYKGKKRNHFLEKSGRSHVMNDVKLSRKRKKKTGPPPECCHRGRNVTLSLPAQCHKQREETYLGTISLGGGRKKPLLKMEAVLKEFGNRRLRLTVKWGEEMNVVSSFLGPDTHSCSRSLGRV